jgi:cellobiose phosphorylase
MGIDNLTEWEFINDNGVFRMENPQHVSYLYFPLVNEAGMKTAITPTLNGDIKANLNSFLTLPVSVEDLHNTRSARNFWVYVDGVEPWSVTGNSAKQIANQFTQDASEQVSMEAGILWHKVTRSNLELGLKAEITNFVPTSNDQIELMQIELTNISNKPLNITPTAAIPIFGRSADNLRDHRHVTSLLHQIFCHRNGVLVRPTLSFDERGHLPNKQIYLVLGITGEGQAPIGFFPIVEDFIGEGGHFDWPEAVIRSLPPTYKAGQAYQGYEAVGGLRFPEVILQPSDTQMYILILAIQEEADAGHLLKIYGTPNDFKRWMSITREYWQSKLNTLVFQTGDHQFDLWMKWVAVQPTLRRLFGNSFLPYHDYGRGGRGWRDLWQDILALLVLETSDVSGTLWENFAGVRFDGSNATIIGSHPGEFKADRNNIPRVWMDHGAWPLLTTQLYIDQTGDLDFLLREQVYFKDHLIERAQSIDSDWETSQGTQQRTRTGEIYLGTVLEHLLVQHLTVFFNVGEHNHIKLEGADWNDGMDMAAQRGESVAFTALYASNLRQLTQLVQELQKSGLEQVNLASELILLLDTLKSKIDYNSINAKQQRLQEYFAAVSPISGKRVAVPLPELKADLFAKADWMYAHIRTQEWITNGEGFSWFNGYYDNAGQRLEGDFADGVRMTLTGQVFTLMGGIATDAQAQKIIQTVDRYLFDESVGGYRLNTNFGEVLLNMGRCFGFAYGHKENGAMFSHMAVMYAYALYRRGYAHQAYKVLNHIYQQSVNFQVSRMYPGIPEYFDNRGRGVYPYLTGSASWYLLTLLTQAFGVRGQLGDLTLYPKLVPEQFDDEGKACVKTWFADRKLEVIYQNPDRVDFGVYKITRVSLNEDEIFINSCTNECRIPRQIIATLEPDQSHQINIWLEAK